MATLTNCFKNLSVASCDRLNKYCLLKQVVSLANFNDCVGVTSTNIFKRDLKQNRLEMYWYTPLEKYDEIYLKKIAGWHEQGELYPPIVYKKKKTGRGNGGQKQKPGSMTMSSEVCYLPQMQERPLYFQMSQ